MNARIKDYESKHLQLAIEHSPIGPETVSEFMGNEFTENITSTMTGLDFMAGTSR